MISSEARVELQAVNSIATAPDYSELIEAVALRRDRAAFAVLFNSLAPKVKGYMMRWGLAPDRAEDLAVETFVKLWTRADTFDAAHGSAAAWIFTIARNTCIDAARQERHPSELSYQMHREPVLTPEDECLGTEREKRVRSALSQLPREQAQLCEISFVQGIPHAEIAANLGLPLGTVKSRLRLAMRRLRTILGEDT